VENIRHYVCTEKEDTHFSLNERICQRRFWARGKEGKNAWKCCKLQKDRNEVDYGLEMMKRQLH
jgi:hypothetical protein